MTGKQSMRTTIDPTILKTINLLANNGNAPALSKNKGYQKVIERTFKIVRQLCEKYNITLNMESLNEIERLLLGFQSDSQGSRFIFTQNGNGDGKTIKAVPVDMNFALLFSDKDGSAGILPDKINLTIDPETFSVNINMPTNYTHSLELLSQQMIAETQKILNFNFKNQTPLLFSENKDPDIVSSNTIDNKSIDCIPKEILTELERRINRETVRLNEKIIFLLVKNKGKEMEQAEIIRMIGRSDVVISKVIVRLRNEGWLFVENKIDGRGQRNIVRLNIEKIIKEGLPPKNETLEEKIENLLNSRGGKIARKEISSILGRRESHVQGVLEIMEKKGKITKVLINKKEKLIMAVKKLKEPDFEEAPKEKTISPVIVFEDGSRVALTEYGQDKVSIEPQNKRRTDH